MFLDHDKQFFGKGLTVRVRMVTGHNDLQLVPVQGVGLQVLHRRQPQKAAVHRAGDNPVLDLVVEIAGDHLKLDVGVQLAEAFQDPGQPLGRHAGKGGDLHQTAVHVLQALHRLHQGVVGGAQLLDLGQHRPAVRRQHHAAPVAAEQRDAQLALQRRDGVADTGLGEVQRLRRLGKGTAGHHLQKHLILGNAHGNHLAVVDASIIHDGRS